MSHRAGEVEIVEYREHGASSVTVKLALDGKLAVPMTCGKDTFWGQFREEKDRLDWLARTARTLLDIFGDARDGRVLTDHEVLTRAAA